MISTTKVRAFTLSRLGILRGGEEITADEPRDRIAQDPAAVRVRRNQLMMLMILFAICAAAFLMLIGEDALQLKVKFQFFADSNSYLKAYNSDVYSTITDLVKVSENYLGPVLVLRMVGGNIYLVMLLNVYLFYFSVIRIAALLEIDPLKTALLLLASPMTISSLLSVNKEIIVFPFMALALTGYVRRSALWLLSALLVSVLVRWQVTAFYLITMGLTLLGVFKPQLSSGPKTLWRRRITSVVLLLIAGSVFYVLFSDFLAPLINVVDKAVLDDSDPGSGSFTALLAYQSQGFYFMVFPLKALHLLFGMGLRLDRLLNPHDVYNDIFVVLHCQATLAMFLIMIRRKMFTLRSDLVFLSCVFLSIFCLTPVYAPRYLYPVFVIWAIVVAGPRQFMPRVAKGIKSPKHLPRQELLPAG